MIYNPNISKQGFDPYFDDNPYHDILTEYGYVYSHTTPVIHLGEKRVDHHTYKLGKRNASVYNYNGWRWDSSVSGSGRATRGTTKEALKKHLKNVAKKVM